MTELTIAISALIAAIATAIKQFTDNRRMKKWLCMRNPCPDRQQGEPPF